jgi:hypothetical protein
MTERRIRPGLSLFDTEVSQFRGSFHSIRGQELSCIRIEGLQRTEFIGDRIPS